MEKRLWLIAAGVLAIGACDTTGPEDGPRVSVFLTDAPGNVDVVWVEVSSITLLGAGGEVDLELEENGLIRLTDLTDDFVELVDDVEIPEGNFNQIRLMVDGVVLRTIDGEVFATTDANLPAGVSSPDGELMCPSCFQTGIKLVLQGGDAEFEEGEDVAVVLDFDVAQSFAHPAGNSGKWVLRPVVHVRLADDDESDLEGNEIRGTVVIETVGGVPSFSIPLCGGTQRDLEDFVPIATASTLVNDDLTPVVIAGEVEEDGEFEIDGVSADTWTLAFVSTDLGDFDLVWAGTVSPTSVTVGDEDVEDVVFTLTGVSCVAN